MKIALITTVYNEESNILVFLESYKRQTIYADEFIIVDGGSTDNTVSILTSFSKKNPGLSLHIIVDEKCNKLYSKGPIAKGRNIAIKYANAEYIAVTDAGCILKENWLEELILPFSDPNVSIICGYYDVLAENDFDLKYSKIFVPQNDLFLPSSRSIAFKKECWEYIGGYPEDSYTAEDTYFDLKLLSNGFKMARAPQAIVYWKFAKDETDLRKKLTAYGMGEGELLIYKRRFLFRLINLIIPIYPIVCKNSFLICYKFYFYQVKGYLEGVLRHFSNI